MNRKIVSGLVVASFLAAMGVSAAEHRGHGGQGMHSFGNPERMVEFMTKQLELDDVQEQSVRNIITAASPEIDELRSRAANNREAIAELDTADPDYSAKLQNLADENGYLASQATQLHGRLRAEIAGQLTPEQQAQLADRSYRMRQHFGGKRRNKDSDSGSQ